MSSLLQLGSKAFYTDADSHLEESQEAASFAPPDRVLVFSFRSAGVVLFGRSGAPFFNYNPKRDFQHDTASLSHHRYPCETREANAVTRWRRRTCYSLLGFLPRHICRRASFVRLMTFPLSAEQHGLA